MPPCPFATTVTITLRAPPNPHYNRPSGHWSCVMSSLVGGRDKYRFNMSLERETAEFQRYLSIASFLAETEMLEGHISCDGTSWRTNLVYLLLLSQFILFNNINSYNSFQIIQFISLSSCRATSTDILDPLSPLLSIVHRFWLVLRAISRIISELLYVGSSWSPCFWSTMCGSP